MSDVTRILSDIEQGDPTATEKLLPLVYEELEKLATAKVLREQPGHTLQTIALVHEAYVRLVRCGIAQTWDGRRHFFAAIAEALRCILIESARRKKRAKRGISPRNYLPDRHFQLFVAGRRDFCGFRRLSAGLVA